MHKNGVMKIHQIKIPFNFIKYNIKTKCYYIVYGIVLYLNFDGGCACQILQN